MFNNSSLKYIQVNCIQTLTLFHAKATNRLKLLFFTSDHESPQEN